MRKQIAYLLILSGGLFMLYGAFIGEKTAVFQKAIIICLECIGIG